MTAAALALGGLVLLAVTSDWFVLGAARLSARLRVPPVIVGAVVVGFGTSAPELLVSGLAVAEGQADLALGNVIGSNVANLTVVLGSAAVVGTVALGSRTIRREAPLSTAAVCVFGVAALVGLGPVAGVVLGAGLVAVLVRVVRTARSSRAADDEDLVDEVTDLEAGDGGLFLTLVMAAAGLAGTLIGAQLVVTGAVSIAEQLGVSEGFVGLTLVAIGTSLPELVTSIQALRRGEDELIVGNVLGSNVFNSLAAGMIIAFGAGGVTVEGRLVWSVVLMVVVAVAVGAQLRFRSRLTRWEGAGLLAAYLATMPLLAGG